MEHEHGGTRRPGLASNAPHADLTFRIIGLAMQVHTDLGPGHREEVYHNALRVRLDGVLDYQDEPLLHIIDELGNVIYQYKPDFLIAGTILVELKALTHLLTRDEEAQIYDYFAASDCDAALLINFGRSRLEWKRLFPPRKIKAHREAQRSGKQGAKSA